MGVRHFQVFMFFSGIAINLTSRVSMSIAIVDMTDDTKAEYFPWSMKIQSVILSSLFWGYLVLQVPFGVVATKFGGKWPLLACVGGNSLMQLMVPPAAYYGGWKLVCACRIIQGLLQGAMLPTVHSLMAKWVPLEEKSSMAMFVYTGTPFGLAAQLLVSGFIANAWGWAAIFYVSGALGVLWSLIYIAIGAHSPETSSYIKDEEKKYIQQSLGHNLESHNKLPTPWKAMFTSPPFLALIVVHIGFSWGMWTLMSEIPTYISKVLGVNIKHNGVLSALPYISMALMGLPFGYLSSFLLKRKLMSVSWIRKFNNSIGYFGGAVALVALSYAATSTAVAIGLLCVAVGLGAGHVTGFMLVHLDMAPNFAGTMMGITNSCACFSAILGPLATGALIHDETIQVEWRKLFYLTAGIQVVTNLVYLVFGTSERQHWNEPCDSKSSLEKPTEKRIPEISLVHVS